jgi:AcrR family transcriptional regulator
MKRQNPYHLDEKKVKHLMVDLGVTAADIARKLKTSKATITRHVKNERRNPEVQKGIADYLKVPLEEILRARDDGAGPHRS